MYKLLPSVLKVYPVGTTNPTREREQPSFSSFSINVGIAVSEELVASTSRISSLMCNRNFTMLNPALQQMAPSTISTNRIEVTQNVAISFTSGPSDANPYLPMVKAMAPNAPIGANRIRMFTTRNTTWVRDSSSTTIGLARGP